MVSKSSGKWVCASHVQCLAMLLIWGRFSAESSTGEKMDEAGG
jgi:hypothetical protein